MTNALSVPVKGSVVERAYGVVPPISGLSGRFDYPAIVGVYLDQANWLGTAWDRNGQIRTPASDAVSGLVVELLERGSIQSISHDYIAISVVRPSFYGAQQVAPNPLRAIAWRDSDGLKSQYFLNHGVNAAKPAISYPRISLIGSVPHAAPTTLWSSVATKRISPRCGLRSVIIGGGRITPGSAISCLIKAIAAACCSSFAGAWMAMPGSGPMPTVLLPLPPA